MDYVTIDNLRVKGIHGCHKYERENPQEFLIALKIGVDARKPGSSDDLAHTIDFDFLKTTVEAAFAGPRHYLVESLAEEIAAEILKDERAKEITVTIQKPEVWPNAIPGIVITRAR